MAHGRWAMTPHPPANGSTEQRAGLVSARPLCLEAVERQWRGRRRAGLPVVSVVRKKIMPELLALYGWLRRALVRPPQFPQLLVLLEKPHPTTKGATAAPAARYSQPKKKPHAVSRFVLPAAASRYGHAPSSQGRDALPRSSTRQYTSAYEVQRIEGSEGSSLALASSLDSRALSAPHESTKPYRLTHLQHRSQAREHHHGVSLEASPLLRLRPCNLFLPSRPLRNPNLASGMSQTQTSTTEPQLSMNGGVQHLACVEKVPPHRLRVREVSCLYSISDSVHFLHLGPSRRILLHSVCNIRGCLSILPSAPSTHWCPARSPFLFPLPKYERPDSLIACIED